MKWAVVVPCNRPEGLDAFRKAWEPLLEAHDAQWFVVLDPPPDEAKVPTFIPRSTDMIRSWGFYEAWKAGAELILSLDDDTLPTDDPFTAYEEGFSREWPLSPYLSVGSLTDSGKEMRGFPHRSRGVQAALQYGGWNGVLDYDAATQIAGVPSEASFSRVCLPVPLGAALTGCAMNMAFRAEVTPIMWQLPLFEGRYNRFGDIWGGLLAKKALDVMGQVVLVNGKAQVRHERASDPQQNLVREAPGLQPNEGLWQRLEGSTYREITDSAARFFSEFDRDYSRYFTLCRNEWLACFDAGCS